MPIISVKATADAKAAYHSDLMQAGIATFKSTKDTSQALQAMASTAMGTAGAAICSAVAGPVGLACGPVVSAAVGAIMSLASSIFGSGPNLIKLKRDECVQTLAALEDQYLDAMQNLILMYYQYWPEEKEADRDDPKFNPGEFTGYAAKREGFVSILRWNAIAQLLVESSKQISKKGLPFPVKSELWHHGTRKYAFPIPVYIPPVLSLASSGDPCMAYTQQATVLLPTGAVVWDILGQHFKVASKFVTSGGGRSGSQKSTPACASDLLPILVSGTAKTGGGATTCRSPKGLFQEDPIPRIQKVIDYLKPAAEILPETINRALFNMAATKSAEEIAQRAVNQAIVEDAAYAKAAYQNMVDQRQADIRGLDRDLQNAQGLLASAKSRAEKSHATPEQLERAQAQTKWAWIAGAAIVGGVVLWSRR